MKTVILLVSALCISMIYEVQAQSEKTIEVDAGKLKSVLAADELLTITNLNIKGTIDARDFKTMRDEMPLLSGLDLSGVSIVSYYGNEGTTAPYDRNYAADEIPYAAFYDVYNNIKNTTLTSIIIPNSINKIGYASFYNCVNLVTVNIPSSVVSIDNYAFMRCSNLSDFTIPSSVTSIGIYSFIACGGKITVEDNNPVFSGYEGALYNKNITTLIHCPSSLTGDYNIPSTVTGIAEGAFYECKNLTLISIPSSVTSIVSNTFYGCNSLSSLTIQSSFPIDLTGLEDVFTGINKNICTLNVPYGSKELYSDADGWNYFTNIIEEENGFNIDAAEVKLTAGSGSSATVNILANVTWNVSYEVSWLTIDQISGNGNQILTITAETNESDLIRTAKITFSADGYDAQILTVIQYGTNKTINISAGRLLSALSGVELDRISDLTVIGTMDARDFKILRDSLPNLSILDLTDVSVAEYSGTEGTQNYYNAYSADAVPPYAFYNSSTRRGKISLVNIELPLSVRLIGYSSFNGCENINSITIPSQVNSIEYNAFTNCTGLTSINIPSSVTLIDVGAFTNCSGYFSVDANNSNYSSLDGVLFNKGRTTLLVCPVSKAGSYSIPTTVMYIEYQAFESCIKLTNISIPSSVISTPGSAFNNCTGLIAVAENNPNYSAFDGVLFNKDATSLMKCPVSKQGSFEIPSTVTTIGEQAFSHCTLINSVTIPQSVTSIGSGAFEYCNGLTSVISESSYPVDLSGSYSVFNKVNPELCILKVPYGAKKFYSVAEGWNNFVNIEEQPNGFILNTVLLRLNAEEGSSDTIHISANVEWTISSSQSWLMVEPLSGSGNGTITFTAAANPTAVSRTLEVEVSASDYISQIIRVTQSGVTKIIDNEAGELMSGLTPEELNSITSLKISGTIDARDFKIMRDNMPSLTDIDLSGTTIIAYSGPDGTSWSYDYPANAIPEYAFSNQYTYPPKSNLASVILPSEITEIRDYAFYYCEKLTSITIPSSVSTIGDEAFYQCKGLTSIYAQPTTPVDLTSVYGVFSGVNYNTCVIYVPYLCGELYSSAYGWKDFKTIIEESQGILLSTYKLKLDAEEGSNTTINVRANVSWTAVADQPWLMLNPNSANGDSTIMITAEANSSSISRTAEIVVSTNDFTSQIATVIQDGIPKTINISAGGLLGSLTPEERNGITSLVLTGTIDARDFKIMRDSMPLLETLDLSGTTVLAYSGPEGTSYEYSYPANTIPEYAFLDPYTGLGKASLISIDLPTSINGIGNFAFQDCKVLNSVSIPSIVSEIGSFAFNGCEALASIDLPTSLTIIHSGVFASCKNLTSISIPSSVQLIGENAFSECTGLTTVNLPSSLVEIWNDAFSGCAGLTSIDLPSSIKFIRSGVFSGCSSLSMINIPPSVTSIGEAAFFDCIGLTSISIPVKLTSIGSYAFYNCTGLTLIYANSSHPVNLAFSPNVFNGIDKNNCALHVPYKAGALYRSADQWKDFTNIIEDTQGFLIDSVEVKFSAPGGTTSVNITANVTWTASFIEDWLTLNPITGTGNESISFTVTANESAASRVALVTISTDGADSQFVRVVQTGIPKTIAVEAGGLLQSLTQAELDGITNLNIEGTIDARDFKTMRDLMPSLEVLDLSDAVIAPYEGSDGTMDYYNYYPGNEIPGYAFFDEYNYQGKTSLTSVKLPRTAVSIAISSFNSCNGLSLITIPAGITSIGSEAFANCSGLNNVKVNSENPVNLSDSWGVFYQVDLSACILNVPFGSKEKYESAYIWQDFTNIVEDSVGFILSYYEIYLSAEAGSKDSLQISGNVEWMVSSNESWCSVEPNSGIENQTLYFMAEANPLRTYRKAQVTVSGTGVESQIIYVTQEGSNEPLYVTAGELITLLTEDELATLTTLILEGTIDARDFKTMRDDMPNLEEIDLSGTTIVAYIGTDGTSWEDGNVEYPANSIPDFAFWIPDTYNGKSSLIKFIFPEKTSSIGQRAFQYSGLNSISLPLSITAVLDGAFYGCYGLDTIKISNLITIIESYALFGIGYINVDEKNPEYSSLDGVLYNKAQTLLIQFPSSKTGHFTIPSSVDTIQYAAFVACRITSITIPSSITFIGAYAFQNSFNLTSISVDSSIPIDLQNSYNVFAYVDKSNCLLKVPYGSKALYEVADQWKEFVNIEEDSIGFILSSTCIDLPYSEGSSGTIEIFSNTEWTINLDSDWLIVSPNSGSGDGTLTFIADENPSQTYRLATVTVSAHETSEQKITVIQDAISNLVGVPIADYPLFEDGEDDTGNNSTMTLINSTFQNGGVYCNGIYEYSGLPDYCIISTPSITNLNLNSFSISVDFYVSEYRKQPVFVCGDLSRWLGFYLNNNETVSLLYNNNNLATSSKTYELNQWHNAKITFDGQIVKMYLDNSLACYVITSLNIALNDIQIGTTNYSNADVLKGYIKNLKVYNLETPELSLSAYSLNIGYEQGNTATVDIISNTVWTISCDESWLTADIVSGTGNKTVNFLADANPASTVRNATVTISGNGYETQTILVTQNGITGITDFNKAVTQFKCYPNPFADKITIEIDNPEKVDITVDIFNMAGEKIINLINAICDEKISIIWDGINDSGRKIAPGLYICKINGITKKLVFNGDLKE